MIKKKPRKTILNKRDKKLDTIGYSKLDIMWFFQWLKLAVDMEGQTLEFGKLSNWSDGTTTTRKGRYDEKQKVVTIKKRVLKPNSKKIVVEGNGLSTINLKELKRLPKIINLNKNERMKLLNKLFLKYKHLFGDFSIHYAERNQDMIDSDDYFTVQIPKSLDRRTIDNQIDTLMKGLKLKTPGGKKRDITFIRGVQKDVMKKQWDIFKWRHIEKRSSAFIATNKKSLNYKSGETLQIKGGKTQTQGVRAVQKSYASAKCIIINVGKGMFPKSTL